MARSRTQVVEAPPRNDRYVVMLGLIALSMLIGCVLMFLDLNSYPDSTAKGGPQITLPKVEHGVGAPRPAGETPTTGAPSGM